MIQPFHRSYSVNPRIAAVEGRVCTRAAPHKVSLQAAAALHALEAPVLGFVRVLGQRGKTGQEASQHLKASVLVQGRAAIKATTD